MLSSIRKPLFKLARSDISAFFIGFVFKYLSFLIPVKKIENGPLTLTFPHPHKFWEHHYLVVPKRKVPSLMSLDFTSERDQELIHEIYQAAVRCAALTHLSDYTILVNGNSYQDVPQLHFHVAAGLDENGNRLGQDKIRFQQTAPPLETEISHWHIFSFPISEKRRQISFQAKQQLKIEQARDPLGELFDEAKRRVQENHFTGFTVIMNVQNRNTPQLSTISIVGETWQK